MVHSPRIVVPSLANKAAENVPVGVADLFPNLSSMPIAFAFTVDELADAFCSTYDVVVAIVLFEVVLSLTTAVHNAQVEAEVKFPEAIDFSSAMI